ncbi:MAG: VTT domain-containing protein [Methylomonas sp.]|nr:VTT domain-containing protein [Methylomonas sp.]
MLKENLFKALAGILLLTAVMAALGYWYDEQMRFATNWVVERIGFAGLCLILFVTDTLVTPISPDILLVVIAHSALAERWLFYVSILSVVSVASGMLGWCIGRWLSHFNVVQKLFGQFNQEQRQFIQKYGFWAIVLGAATPLPYSVTCWTAGALQVKWTTVLTASILFRIPRIIVYYLFIASASNLFA